MLRQSSSPALRAPNSARRSGPRGPTAPITAAKKTKYGPDSDSAVRLIVC